MPCAQPQSDFPLQTACAPVTPRSSCLLAHVSLRLVYPPFDTTGGVGVQPAAESRHIQRHKHAHDVLGAHLTARALRPMSSRAFPCRPLAPPSPHTPPVSLHARTSPCSVCPPFKLAECVGVQPAAESRHVQRHRHERHVSGALRPCHAQRSGRHRSTPLSYPCPNLALPRMPSFRLGSRRRRSTSR